MVATEENNNRVEEKEGEPKIANLRWENTTEPIATLVTTAPPEKKDNRTHQQRLIPKQARRNLQELRPSHLTG